MSLSVAVCVPSPVLEQPANLLYHTWVQQIVCDKAEAVNRNGVQTMLEMREAAD